MSAPFEDLSRWPVSRYLREVVASQPDGRLLLWAGALNWCVGAALALSLMSIPLSPRIGWVHAVLFFGTPLIGFAWLLRDMPPPQLTFFERVWRQPWQRKGDTLFQVVPALLPWVVLVGAHVH